jgi:hypothetical protein
MKPLAFVRPLLVAGSMIGLLSVITLNNAAQQGATNSSLPIGELMLESVSLEERSHVYTFNGHPECITVVFIRNDTMEIGPNVTIEDISGARPRLINVLELPAFGQELLLPPGAETYRLTTNFTMSQEFPLQFYWLQLRLECDSVAANSSSTTSMPERISLSANGRSVLAISSTGQPVRLSPVGGSGSRVTLVVRDSLTNRILNALRLNLAADIALSLPIGDLLLEFVSNQLDDLELALQLGAAEGVPLVEVSAVGSGLINVAADGSIQVDGRGVQVSAQIATGQVTPLPPSAGAQTGSGGVGVNVNVNPPAASAPGSGSTTSPAVDVQVETGSSGVDIDVNVNPPAIEPPPVNVPPVEVPVELPPVQVPTVAPPLLGP